MTTLKISEKTNGWASLDGHGCWPVYFAETEESCVAEAIRRGHSVTHHGRKVVSADQTYVHYEDGTIAVLLGNIGIEVIA